jgi:alpha-pyrone synthase
MSVITAIGTANPQTKVSQDAVAEKIAKILQISDSEKEKLKRVFKGTKIETRYSVIKDFGEGRHETFFKNNTLPRIGERMAIYKREVPPLAFQAIDQCLREHNTDPQSITHVVTCSSTGFYAPGLDTEIITQYNLPAGTGRTCVNNMGCCGAFNALQVADAIAGKNPDANVLVVCIEICTLHFTNNKSLQDLIATSLFSDGAAAVLVSGNDKEKGLLIKNFYTAIHPDDGSVISWYIRDNGFEVNLSSYIPALVKEGVGKLVSSLLKNTGLKLNDIDLFALHPGGRKIIEVCEKELALTPEDAAYSYSVMQHYGNMSSVTILFVLKKILTGDKKQEANLVLGLGFGPGLAMESMLLEVNHGA